MSTSVRYYDSTMSGAPVLSGTAGALLGVLDACLVDGFGTVTLDSLVANGNVVTGTISTGHNFAMVGNTGPVIRIAGATPNELNGDWRVTVTSSSTFTFATTGISDQTATGTITAKRAPAGFSKAFSGTNKASYRPDSIQSTRLYLRIDDTGTTTARVRGYETMTDVDTGTGLFPTDAQVSGGLWTLKSDAASSASRKWTIFSDGKIVYCFISQDTSSWSGGFVFGDIVPVISNDAYHCMLTAMEVSNGTFRLYYIANATASYFPRAYTQIGGSVASARYSHRLCSSYIGTGGYAYPSVVGNLLQLWPIECSEPSGIRGTLPGAWCPVHNGITHGIMFNNIPQLPSRDFIVQLNTTSGCMVIDLTGPWR